MVTDWTLKFGQRLKSKKVTRAAARVRVTLSVVEFSKIGKLFFLK